MKKRSVKKAVIIAILSIAVLLLAAGWVHFVVLYSDIQSDKSYISTDDEVDKILRGILQNNARLSDGADADITYDFNCPEYAELKTKYNLEQLAGSGTELEKSARLMHAFSSRLAHGGSYNSDGIKMNSLDLLEYCLDKPEHTINCRCKSQLFGEMCLSLGIYARKIWILPYSQLDDECHVVTEIYDTSCNKWIMLDFTNEMYFTDENGTPLSVTEIRDSLINDTPMKYMSTESGTATAIPSGDTTATRIYYLKNTAYFSAMKTNSFGEQSGRYYLLPAGITEELRTELVGENGVVVSAESFDKSPF